MPTSQRPKITARVATVPTVERLSATDIRISLPFAVGMVLNTNYARALRDALSRALEAIAPGDERVLEAIAYGRQWAHNDKLAGLPIGTLTAKIYAIKKFREMTGCGLADAKQAIDAAWNNAQHAQEHKQT